ncbi:MAG: 3-deoxy-7-phosphoheptulonate synthase [Chloroflexota bacterium]|nr:MAG: 3-deoxy-7-phosphoheptulonate synthase [Chloroflexota bacterium]
MIVIMKSEAGTREIDAVLQRLNEMGLSGHLSRGVERTIIGVVGQTFPELKEMLNALEYVEDVVPISKPFKLASREFQPEDTIIQVGNVRIGGPEIVVMAGPCAIESEDQLMDTARAVKAAGATILRAGAFKPSTSPYNFRGLGKEGLELLAEARKQTGLPVITEVLTPADVELVAQYADILQIGTRNMQNFVLLEEAGRTNKPVMLKRGMSATLQEWLLSAEYILARGNGQVMLCERGIRTFETYTRNTMDVAAIPAIAKLSHLPIIADPSHAAGRWSLVSPLALASIAAGADGLIIEVHPSPDHALKDGAQSLNFENFGRLLPQAESVAAAVGRRLAKPTVTI